MNLLTSIFKFFVFPGLIFALPVGLFLLWLERKLTARMQARLGPPFMQPFYDVIKLLAKQPVKNSSATLQILLPLVAILALLLALTLLPVLSPSLSFQGDLILLFTLLEIPMICRVIAGFTSSSVYGEVGATREAVLSLAYNLPFLAGIAILAQQAGSFQIADLRMAAFSPLVALALVSMFFSFPAKLHLNPFSLANAEQEIYSGPTTEFSGPVLAAWELVHAFEWVALTGLLAALLIPAGASWLVEILLLVLGILVLGTLLAVLSAATARLRLRESIRLYWQAGAGMIALAAVVILILQGGS